MKYTILIIAIASILGGCSSSPKVLMKNCTKIHDDYYECDPMPDKHVRDRR